MKRNLIILSEIMTKRIRRAEEDSSTDRKELKCKWAKGVTLKITDQYLNMKKIVEEHMHLIDHAKRHVRQQVWHH